MGWTGSLSKGCTHVSRLSTEHLDGMHYVPWLTQMMELTDAEVRMLEESVPDVLAERPDLDDPAAPDTPERALFRAVLQQGLTDYFEDPRKSTTQDARDWVWAESEDVGSFHWYCEYLGMNPTYLRNLVSKREELNAIRDRLGSAPVEGVPSENPADWNSDSEDS